MISLERLKEIKKNIDLSYGWDGKETKEERAEICEHWKTMSGNSCFYDAVRDLINKREGVTA
jgi:hypothetical protein